MHFKSYYWILYFVEVWGESESFSSFVSIVINLSISRCLSHLESKGPLDLTDIPSTDRARQCSWRGFEATTSVRESTITHRECTCCGPSTKNREPLWLGERETNLLSCTVIQVQIHIMNYQTLYLLLGNLPSTWQTSNVCVHLWEEV